VEQVTFQVNEATRSGLVVVDMSKKLEWVMTWAFSTEAIVSTNRGSTFGLFLSEIKKLVGNTNLIETGVSKLLNAA
jgi:hypothetical protein